MERNQNPFGIRPRLTAAPLSAPVTLALAACSSVVPNTTLTPQTEFGRAIDDLWDVLLIGGVAVFVFVSLGLLFVVWRFRYREGAPEPKRIYGSASLELIWTLIPAIVLAFIAVPTVRTIFATQAKAVPTAVKVEVVGHQWWWEFRYPEYGVVTANELYLPVGRTASFALMTADVLHSFWFPQMGGKRDLISNDTTYLWFTPESTYAWNGVCVEYCGTSHANMRMKLFTVTPEDFEAWIAHQKSGPAFAPPAAAAAAAPAPAPGVATPDTTTGPDTARPPVADTAPPNVAPVTTMPVRVATYPVEQLPPHARSTTPIPAGMTLANVTGDATRGAQIFKTNPVCSACHTIQGVAAGVVGPNLTHVGSRTSIAAGLYPNDAKHLALWIKNSPAMKPGSKMPPFGKSAQLPAGFDDQQIADIAAYLLSLK